MAEGDFHLENGVVTSTSAGDIAAVSNFAGRQVRHVDGVFEYNVRKNSIISRESIPPRPRVVGSEMSDFVHSSQGFSSFVKGWL